MCTVGLHPCVIGEAFRLLPVSRMCVDSWLDLLAGGSGTALANRMLVLVPSS